MRRKRTSRRSRCSISRGRETSRDDAGGRDATLTREKKKHVDDKNVKKLEK